MLASEIFINLKNFLETSYAECGSDVCVEFDTGDAKRCCGSQVNISLLPSSYSYVNIDEQPFSTFDCDKFGYLDFDVFISKCREEIESPVCGFYNTSTIKMMHAVELTDLFINNFFLEQNLKGIFVSSEHIDSSGGCVTYRNSYRVKICKVDCDTINTIESNMSIDIGVNNV